MSFGLLVLVVFIGFGIGLWLLSHIMEALRPVPRAPKTLRWAPDILINYIDVGGYRLRYIKAGRGPNLVLLHSIRTQLDLFEKVVPELANHFTVYALDYPGHGYSDIPKARYDADFFADSVEGFLIVLDLRDVTLSGVSIGGAIPLIIAGRRNPRVARVVAINPYDYAKGRGMARSSLPGWMVTVTSDIPVIGETVMRLRNFIIMKAVLRVASRIQRAFQLRSYRKCMRWVTGPAITVPSSVCYAMPRAGRWPRRHTEISTSRCVSFGVTRIGLDPASASTIAVCFRALRW
jgi:pimeloyl-ACP methyl ester carboxylesterase